MIKAYLLTYQEPGAVRQRQIVHAMSSFEALAKLIQVKKHVDCYIAVRPATNQDIEKYGDEV